MSAICILTYLSACILFFSLVLSHAGPSHMSLYLMPHRGASLSTWSFGDGTPQFDLSGEYFIFYSHGLNATTWTFWFEIQVLSANYELFILINISYVYWFFFYHVNYLACFISEGEWR